MLNAEIMAQYRLVKDWRSAGFYETDPEMQSPLEGEQTLLRRVAIQLLHHPKLVAFFRRP